MMDNRQNVAPQLWQRSETNSHRNSAGNLALPLLLGLIWLDEQFEQHFISERPASVTITVS